jgi:bifunctional DNA-binding transcriptional regulator/antitoxin component of YhaV-PrlF toxin-antitoxin module
MVESMLTFAVEIGTTYRITIPPEVVKALHVVVGDILELNVSKIVHIKEVT